MKVIDTSLVQNQTCTKGQGSSNRMQRLASLRQPSMYVARAASRLSAIARSSGVSTSRSLSTPASRPAFKNDLHPRLQRAENARTRGMALLAAVVLIGWPIEAYLTR
jgi:hypothetical protein